MRLVQRLNSCSGGLYASRVVCSTTGSTILAKRVSIPSRNYENRQKFSTTAFLCQEKITTSSSAAKTANEMLSSLQPPPVRPHWFFATDVSLREPDFLLGDEVLEGKLTGKKETPKRPKKFMPFSDQDNALLEKRYQEMQNKVTSDAIVPVREDYLFEVDIDTMELSPVYWDGPIFEVRRSEWLLMDGSNAIPCSKQLNDQLENGYNSKKPWMEMKEKSISIKNSMEEVSAGTSTNWVLKGERYQGKLCVYSTDCYTAWIMSNDVYGMLTAAFLQKIASGNILGASKLIRGYDHVKKKEDSDEKKKNGKKKKIGEFDEKPDTRKMPLTPDLNHYASAQHKLNNRYGSQASEQEQMEQDYEDTKEKAGSHASQDEDKAPQYDHLVLCVHGIGQKLGRRIKSVNFVHDVNVLRKTMKSVFNEGKQFQKYRDVKIDPEKDKEEREWTHPKVQVLPVLWRSHVTFNLTKADILQHQGDPNSQVCLQDITVDGISSVRNIAGDVILDVLLYYQPFYRRQINQAVINECNRIVTLFRKHNPKFRGKVSVIGHSLGSVISFDVLSNDMTCPGMENNNTDGLEFPVENYFMMGSPVGLFKILEGNSIRHFDAENHKNNLIADETKFQPSLNYLSPNVKYLYNIFHPSDPISYRVEPLVDKLAAFLRPASVPFTKSGFSTESISNLGRQVAEGAQQMWNTIYTSGESITQKLLNAANFLEQQKQEEQKEAAGEENEQPSHESAEFPSTSSISKRKLTPEERRRVITKLGALSATGRIDYALQESVLDLGFISAIASHVSYLEDEDVAAFVLQRLLEEQKDLEKKRQAES
ncbi:putative phospholipase C20G8.02 [Yarrowia sp. E02]|nr:putative phospholipase C20G8.02 [Yarrowia sp. E02]